MDFQTVHKRRIPVGVVANGSHRPVLVDALFFIHLTHTVNGSDVTDVIAFLRTVFRSIQFVGNSGIALGLVKDVPGPASVVVSTLHALLR